MISRTFLFERFYYDAASGALTWRTHHWSSRIGREAGWIDEHGYRYVRLIGHLHAVHRLIWLLVTGESPEFIDHVDTQPSNNLWGNLRSATKLMNQENRRRAGKNNKAGLLGVSPNGSRWAASIVSHRIKYHLGTFDSPQQAHAIYVLAKRQRHSGGTL